MKNLLLLYGILRHRLLITIFSMGFSTKLRKQIRQHIRVTFVIFLYFFFFLNFLLYVLPLTGTHRLAFRVNIRCFFAYFIRFCNRFVCSRVNSPQNIVDKIMGKQKIVAFSLACLKFFLFM